MSYAHRGLTVAGTFAALVATGMIASVARGQLPAGWQSSGTGSNGYTVGYDVSRQSGGRQASGLEERSAYIAANIAEPLSAATLTQAIRSDDYRGRRVRLSGFIRKSGGLSNTAMLFLRVEGSGLVSGTDQRSATVTSATAGTSEWVQHQIVVDVPVNSTGLRFGFLKGGDGEAWLRSVKLELVGSAMSLTGVAMMVGLDAGTPGAIANRLASREATYRRLSRQPINLDFSR